MIKLIATDMDGTLLDENSKLPDNFFTTLEDLKKQGILFAIASGRPYKTLYENFKPHSDEMYFICDNGAYIVKPGKTPIINVIDPSIVNEILTVCSGIDDICVLLCGEKHFYYQSVSEEALRHISKYYKDCKQVSNLKTVDDNIFKIAICDLQGSATHSYPILQKHFDERVKVVISGELWIDINNLGVNKGVALKQLQKDFSITKEETMVFGDFYNDIEMLQNAHYSFVMDNANDDMKQYGNYIAPRNSENGVIRTIHKYALAPLAR